jgi:hypothetical protein
MTVQQAFGEWRSGKFPEVKDWELYADRECDHAAASRQYEVLRERGCICMGQRFVPGRTQDFMTMRNAIWYRFVWLSVLESVAFVHILALYFTIVFPVQK